MKKKQRFELTEFLKNPARKVVNGFGYEVRIICTNRNAKYCVIGLVDNVEIRTYRADGRFLEQKEAQNDLYFGD